MTMKRCTVFAAASFAASLMLAGCAVAQTPPPPAGTAPPPPPATADSTPKNVKLTADSPVDDVLDALDSRGKSLSDFPATVKLTDSDPALGRSSTRTGKMWLQRRSPTDARIRVSFEKKIA